MSQQKKPTVLTGIKPSGHVHLGNYLGAIKHWVAQQDQKDNFFMIADLHTITVEQDPQVLHKRTRELAAWLIACGIDPQSNTLFIQSHNPDHAQLAWILNCFTSMGELSRMTQYKEKADKQDFISVGLFTYPALMAADILLYQTDEVPVGDDQKQHVELTRDIATRFNHRYEQELFKLPQPVIAELGSRIMSLQSPENKMSKSEKDPAGTLDLQDNPNEIVKKIKRAVTDSGSEITMLDDKPAISNLLQIYSEVSGKSIMTLEQEYQRKGYGIFKSDLAEAVVTHLKPIQQHYREMIDSSELEQILKTGAEKARQKSRLILEQVISIIGLG